VKTTVELNDVLLAEARDLAHREGRTFKSVLEEALHALLVQHSTAGDFVLPDCSAGRGWLREEWVDRSLNDAIEDAREREFS
jgi:hypothetical protein